MSADMFSAQGSGRPYRRAQHSPVWSDTRVAIEAPVPCMDRSPPGGADHVVLVYDEAAHLLDAVSHFTGTGLTAGEATLVIATPSHRDQLEARLRAQGVDLVTAQAHGQYIAVDAAEMLAHSMVDGCPDWKRFLDVVGGLVASAGHRYPHVRAFGEMVTLLWADGNGDAALRLEEFWNQLATIHPLMLLCGYPLHGFARAGHAQTFHAICAAHAYVIPSEGYTALDSPAKRLRTIAHLQQEAQALKAEVAERQHLAIALRHREEELADFFDNAAIGCHWVGPDGTILRVNHAELTMLGYTREDYLGHPIADFHADPSVIADIVRRLYAGETLQNYEARLVCKDGTLKHVLLDANVRWDDQGQFLHTRCFTRDITAQKQAEAAVQQAYAVLEQRVEERTAALQQAMAERQSLEREAQQAAHFAQLGRLAAGVSHEIRNPLAAIFLHVDLLEEELRAPSPESAVAVIEALGEIKTQVGRLDDLVQDYLSLARVAHIQRQAQDLGSALQTWGTEFQQLGAAHGVTVHLDGVEELGLVAFHASTLRRAVGNLVQNALDATPCGGTVTVAGQGTAHDVQIQVRDTGSGIPAEHVGRIFEPLYTTKPGGTGLGLYIVQEIVKAHEGQMAVQSIPGQGTTFVITLPRTGVGARLRA